MAQKRVFAFGSFRPKIFQNDPVPKNNQPIKQNFLRGKINWKSVALVQDPQYPMNDHT